MVVDQEMPAVAHASVDGSPSEEQVEQLGGR